MLLSLRLPYSYRLRAEADEAEWAGLMDLIDFEISHTLSRKSQITCLKERIDVQMTLASAPLFTWTCCLWSSL